jgi:hypothetical protein
LSRRTAFRRTHRASARTLTRRAFASIRGLAMLQVTHGTTSRLVAEHWRHMRGHLLELLGDGGGA